MINSLNRNNPSGNSINISISTVIKTAANKLIELTGLQFIQTLTNYSCYFKNGHQSRHSNLANLFQLVLFILHVSVPYYVDKRETTFTTLFIRHNKRIINKQNVYSMQKSREINVILYRLQKILDCICITPQHNITLK